MRMGELWHSAEDWDYYTVPQAGCREPATAPAARQGARRVARTERHDLGAVRAGGLRPLGRGRWRRLELERCAPGVPARSRTSRAADRICAGSAVRSPVTDDYALSPIQTSIIAAAVEEGLEHNPDYNGDHLDGISQEQVTMKEGRRSNTWTAYLKPVRDQLDIRTGCHVHSVMIEDGRAVGVRYRQDGADHEIRADEVVLAAGALDSPAILLRSGIGPAGELEQLGIPLVLTVRRSAGTCTIICCRRSSSRRPPSRSARRRAGLGDADAPLLEEPARTGGPRYAADQLLGADVRRDPRADRRRRILAHGGDRDAEEPRTLTLSGPGLDDPLRIDLQALADDEDVASLVASVRQCRSIGRQPALGGRVGRTGDLPGSGCSRRRARGLRPSHGRHVPPPGGARAAWGGMPKQWSTAGSGCAASRASA